LIMQNRRIVGYVGRGKILIPHIPRQQSKENWLNCRATCVAAFVF
jgi:hypothetical protein